MTDEPKTPRAKKLKAITGPLQDKWDADMQLARAWDDPSLPLANRVATRRAELDIQRQVAREQYQAAKEREKECELLIESLTGAMAILDEVVNFVLKNTPPEGKE